jgi:iron(III) transport system substrate-binding protein
MANPHPLPLAAGAIALAVAGSTALHAQDHTVPEEIVAAAEAEDGVLQYYFGRGYEANRPLFDAFVEAYPFVNLEVTGGGTLSLVEKVLSENAAGQPIAEIIQGGPAEELILSGEDLTMTYRPEGEARAPENMRFDGNYVVSDYFTFHVAYNPTMLDEDELPTSLEDLAEEEWRGRFGIDVNQVDWFAGVLAYYGEEEGLALMQRLADNDPVIFAGAQGYELSAAGGLPIIANTFSGQLLRYIDGGAPIDVAKTDWVIAQPDMYIGIDSSDSPNTVKLFFEFLFTDAAQAVFSELYKNPVVPGAPLSPLLEDALAEDVEIFFVTSENWGDVDTRIQQFQDLFVEAQ